MPSCYEPEVSVPFTIVGGAAEILDLLARFLDAQPDRAVRRRLEAFLEQEGAEPGPAADWLLASARRLRREAESVLAYEGMAVDPGLARFCRPSWRVRPGADTLPDGVPF